MKALFQSTLSLLMLGALLVLTLFNTCQIDNLEKRLIAAGATVARRGSEGAETPKGKARYEPSAEERAALADPANLLVPFERSFYDDAKIARGGTLRLANGQDPRGLNPYIANGSDSAEYARYVNNRLCQRGVEDPGQLSPELAVSITTPDNGLTYDVTLREGVYWHRPTVEGLEGDFQWLNREHELTSDDFIFVFDMLSNPQVAGRVSALRNYFDLDRYESLGRYRFRVTYKERLFTNLPNLCDLHPSPRWLMMYDESGERFDDATWGVKVSEHWYNNKAIGTGPYRFVSWEPGTALVFEKNQNYWREEPAFDRIQVRILKDQNSWTRLLKTGELDLTRVQPEQYRTEVLEAKGPILGNASIKETRRNELGYFYIGWNHDTPYFDSKEARLAMTLALDRASIVRSVFYGLGEQISGPFPKQSPCYDPSIEPHPFDLSLAGRKLDEAGWRDTDNDGIRDKVVDGKKIPFEFTLIIFGSSTEYATLANIYREALLQVGVRLNPRPVEWSTMLKKLDERDFDAYTGAWVVDWESDLYQLWHSSEADRPKSSNRIGFRNKDADRIAETLRRTFDDRKRIELCHEFHALTHELQPYTFIYQRERPILYWDHLNEPEFMVVFPFRDPRLFSFRELPN